MEEDIKVLEDMRDEIYGAMDFEDDYQVRNFEQKQFDALNLAIKHLRKTRLVHSQFIPKSKVRELQNKYKNKIEKLESKKIWNEPVDTINKNRYTNYYNAYEELLQEGDK